MKKLPQFVNSCTLIAANVVFGAVFIPTAEAQQQPLNYVPAPTYIPPVPNPTPVPTPAAAPAPIMAQQFPMILPQLQTPVSIVPLPVMAAVDFQPEGSLVPQRGYRTARNSRPVNLQTVEWTGFTVRMTDTTKATCAPGNVLKLQNGEICLETFGPSTVLAGNQKICLDGHSITLIDKKADTVTVRNLYDRKTGTVRVIDGKQSVNLQIGHEAIINSERGKDIVPHFADNVGRRKSTRMEMADGSSLLTSEVSLVSLFKDDPLMSTLAKSKKDNDRELIDRALKSAVILNMTTASHGEYYVCRRPRKSTEVASITSASK